MLSGGGEYLSYHGPGSPAQDNSSSTSSSVNIASRIFGLGHMLLQAVAATAERWSRHVVLAGDNQITMLEGPAVLTVAASAEVDAQVFKGQLCLGTSTFQISRIMCIALVQM